MRHVIYICYLSRRGVYQSTRHTVMSSHGNSSPVNSSHTRLDTQSTRHITKPPQCRAVRFNYLSLTSLYHSTDDSWQVICGRGNLKEARRCTLNVQRGKSVQRVQSWSHQRRQSSRMWRMLDQKVWSTRHNAVSHDGQLVTPFYGVTSWPCDELTGSRRGSGRAGRLWRPVLSPKNCHH